MSCTYSTLITHDIKLNINSIFLILMYNKNMFFSNSLRSQVNNIKTFPSCSQPLAGGLASSGRSRWLPLPAVWVRARSTLNKKSEKGLSLVLVFFISFMYPNWTLAFPFSCCFLFLAPCQDLVCQLRDCVCLTAASLTTYSTH
jgi:hypothetical protein